MLETEGFFKINFLKLLVWLSPDELLVVLNALFYLMFEKSLKGCFLSSLQNLENRLRGLVSEP